ncbi:MAG: hypothetical protein ACJ72V_16000 [Nitrososphaeraceae archaeon]
MPSLHTIAKKNDVRMLHCFSVLVELGIDSYGSQNNLYDEWIEYKPS